MYEAQYPQAIVQQDKDRGNDYYEIVKNGMVLETQVKDEIKLGGRAAIKIDGFINVDINPANEPDVVCDILQGLPYETSSVEEIVLFHTIELIFKSLDIKNLFLEIRTCTSPGWNLLSFVS